MKKQHQNKIQQSQSSAQVQKQNTSQGGVDMNKNQSQIYFVTFVSKIDSAKARAILIELRKMYPTMTPIFTPRPSRGKRRILEIDGIVTIITIPYSSENSKQVKEQALQEGFTMRDLLGDKKI